MDLVIHPEVFLEADPGGNNWCKPGLADSLGALSKKTYPNGTKRRMCSDVVGGMKQVENARSPEMSVAQARFGVVRVPFLALTLTCMALAVTLVWPAMATADGYRVLWVMLAAVSAHVSVNAFNEFQDFRSGLDLKTRRTPFSGGSGALPTHPQLLAFTGWVAAGSLMLTTGLGMYLLWSAGAARWPLLGLGLLGVVLVLSYTPWLTRRPWLCAIAPGLAFGPIFVWGTCLALVQHLPAAAWWAAALPFGFTNNLLLLNQVPDIDADREVGRRTLPMFLGRAALVRVMVLQWGLALAAVGAGVVVGHLPQGALWVYVLIPLVVMLAWQLTRWASPVSGVAMAVGQDVPPGMALNVALAVLAPALLAVGMAI